MIRHRIAIFGAFYFLQMQIWDSLSCPRRLYLRSARSLLCRESEKLAHLAWSCANCVRTTSDSFVVLYMRAYKHNSLIISLTQLHANTLRQFRTFRCSAALLRRQIQRSCEIADCPISAYQELKGLNPFIFDCFVLYFMYKVAANNCKR